MTSVRTAQPWQAFREPIHQRVVVCPLDLGMGSDLVNRRVVEALQKMYGTLYTHQNVIISGSHTHGGAAGFLQYVLFQITSLGFVNQTFQVTLPS
jgi:neutral ceramidase